MDLKALLARKLVVPFYERRWGTHPGPLMGSLQQSQYEEPEKLRDAQWTQVKHLLEFVHASNPLYQGRLRSVGVAPQDLREWKDFEAIPLLTKEDIRSRADDLLSQGHSRERMFHKRTGGSTGVPVHLYWDDGAHRFKSAIVKRHDLWAGYRPGIKRAALWGDTEKDYPLKLRVYKALCERTIYLDTLKMDDVHLDAFVGRIRRFRPEILIGHAHSLYFFTEYLIEQGVEDVHFKGLISTAETLVPPERALVESYFGKILFDRYGCEEVSLIASECESHDGLHIGAEGLYVEVLGGDETTPGRVVVTDLVNRGMPFIRYEVGDLATLATGRCSCGRGLPRLGRVFGRISDILYAPDGRKISGVSILDTFLIHVRGVRQAQIVQEALDHVTLRIVKDSGFGPATIEQLESTVRKVFGPAMRHDIDYVDAIAPTPRGKYQFSICEVDPSQTSRST
jgi:phenylacetate-CoA ligase